MIMTIYIMSMSSGICISKEVQFLHTYSETDSVNIIFTKSSQTLGNTRTFGIATGDIDNDGDNDIIIPDYLGQCRLWLNNGNGIFTLNSQSFGNAASHDAKIIDLNGDNHKDILVLNHAGPSKVYFNNGIGVFTSGSQNIGSSTDNPGMVAFSDVENDGDIDMYISRYQLTNQLWLNNGSGVFSLSPISIGGNKGHSMVLADFNGDSYPDLFITLIDAKDELWMNDGHGNFINSGQQLGDIVGYESVSCGDIDGDGDLDLVVSNSQKGVRVFSNLSNTGTFSETQPYFGQGSNLCKLFDADVDGDLDLITAHSQEGNLLWINNGTGNFDLIGAVFGTMKVFAVDCADFDGDNSFDVVFGQLEGSGGNSVYFNKSTLSTVSDFSQKTSPNFYLVQNYPNPFNPTTTIAYQLHEQAHVRLSIANALGETLYEVVNEIKPTGTYEYTFDGGNLPTGVYFYQLIAGESRAVRKMILLR